MKTEKVNRGLFKHHFFFIQELHISFYGSKISNGLLRTCEYSVNSSIPTDLLFKMYSDSFIQSIFLVIVGKQ